ncbi:UL55 protein [Gallid alphaherpesvirus 3]|uniref:UL55 protein n=3 Tax=Alphaherpesvirinae TaxID=10293 RepID=Q782N7_9ALPH|nr:nuclear protein UL55 [Gallid alphaherpesvirus 3]YP_010795657.1 UL55 protein [Gallid alphaherpesvirus 3]BAA33006.1 UL55 [Gallid alphaherpesvirus 1]BAA82953.1 UL55 product homolog [Marek's disease virus serotype 2 MDV2]AEI00266.1 UL55 protein [Gallid alphaherpesvirus 3]QEY02285.1 UL55 protein [Gallid alphaherpesvirus 3]BAB16567.1 UL55 protein [Gallid alphaherpesvirus 3]
MAESTAEPSASPVRIPYVWQVIAPLAIDVPSASTQLATGEHVSCAASVIPRSYVIRAACKSSTTFHAFFFGLATDPSENMSQCGASYIAYRMNKKLRTGRLTGDQCESPFSHATIIDSLDENYSMAIEGLCFHCHCENKFSLECWRSAFSAAEKIASQCRAIREYGH